jgi:hypothetical protein
MSEDRTKRLQRRKNHIAKDLRTPKYKHQVIDGKKIEDEEERRYRRYKQWEDE